MKRYLFGLIRVFETQEEAEAAIKSTKDNGERFLFSIKGDVSPDFWTRLKAGTV